MEGARLERNERRNVQQRPSNLRQRHGLRVMLAGWIGMPSRDDASLSHQDAANGRIGDARRERFATFQKRALHEASLVLLVHGARSAAIYASMASNARVLPIISAASAASLPF